MKATNYSINIHWDKRYPKAGTDLCPVQLAVSLNGLQFKMSLRLYASKADFDKAIIGTGGSAEAKELRKHINGYVSKAEHILERLPNPTREVFQRLFKSETDLFATSKTEIGFLFDEYILRLYNEDRIRSAQNMQGSLKSFKKYKTAAIYFEDINEAWLVGYKNWMIKEGNSTTTVQIYLRNLRTIFNKAIKDGFISERHYPFKNYTIGTSARSKSVLYSADLKKLWEYKGTTLREQRAKDYFFFLYLCNGMNFKDCCHLKFKDLKQDTLSFVREKTKRTNTVADKKIVVFLHEEIRAIIEKWGNKNTAPDNYIFPVLNGKITALEMEKRKVNMQRQINDKLKEIGKKLAFEESLILNLARHSFATHLKISGTPTSFITDALGHSSSKTTEHYLKSIPTQKYREISDSLLNFG